MPPFLLQITIAVVSLVTRRPFRCVCLCACLAPELAFLSLPPFPLHLYISLSSAFDPLLSQLSLPYPYRKVVLRQRNIQNMLTCSSPPRMRLIERRKGYMKRFGKNLVVTRCTA